MIGELPMQVDYSAILEKSVWDLLQYKKNGTMDEVLRIVMEALLKAEQKGFLEYGERDRKNKEENGKINELILQLYVKGLTTKDISTIVEEIYGKEVSSTQVSIITNNLRRKREVIKEIKPRGVKEVLLFIIDEFKEIEWAILENFPDAKYNTVNR